MLVALQDFGRGYRRKIEGDYFKIAIEMFLEM